MLLQEQDWDNPGGVIAVEWEYPDAPIKALVDWLRSNKAWLENPAMVERRIRRFNSDLMDLRNSGQARRYLPHAGQTVTVGALPVHEAQMTVSGTSTGPTAPVVVEDRKAAQLANLAKGRAKAAANRAKAKAPA